MSTHKGNYPYTIRVRKGCYSFNPRDYFGYFTGHYAVVDFNFYCGKNGEMILKELSALTYGGAQHLWIIKPPYDEAELPALTKSRNRWKCKSTKGAVIWKWSDGDVPYDQYLQLLKDSVKDQKVIFAYGQKKSRWLANVLKCHVVNIQPQYKRTLDYPIRTWCDLKTGPNMGVWTCGWDLGTQILHRRSCSSQRCFSYMHFLKENESKYGLSVFNLGRVLKSDPDKFKCYRQNCFHFFELTETLFKNCDKTVNIVEKVDNITVNIVEEVDNLRTFFPSENEIDHLVSLFSKLTLN